MKKQSFLILFLLFFIFIGVVSFFERATTYIGQNALESDTMEHLQESYATYLYETEVAKQSELWILQQNPVKDVEIEAYHAFYGTEEERIENVKAQYADAKGDALKERDEKIAKIKAEFQDEELVRQKVERLKKIAIEGYVKEKQQLQETFTKPHHFNYTIEVDGQQLKEKNENGHPIHSYTQSYPRQQTIVGVSASEYMENAADIHFDLNIEQPAATIQVDLLDSIYIDSNYGDEIENFTWRQVVFCLIWLLTALAIVYVVIERKQLKGMMQQLQALPLPRVTKYIDVNIAIGLTLLWMSMMFVSSIPSLIENIVYTAYYGHSIFGIVWSAIELVIFAVVSIGLALVLAKLVQQLRQKPIQREQFVSSKVISYGQQVFYNRSIGKQMLVALFVFACAGFGLAVVFIQPIAIIIYVPLFVAIVIPTAILFLRRFAQLSKVIEHTEKLANGQVVEPLEPKGHSIIANHIDHINKLQAGVRDSMQAQAKSERMKTELITNVSHDLRTPLTSIITYTDLLKSDNLTEEERHKYVAILEAKSQRLKTLIEDLFEVSKMASGNVDVQRQQIDIAQLLQQAAGEHEEDFEQASLALRLTIADQPLYVQADGQKLSRVIDNLLINARKYSLANTRVYVSLQQQQQQAVLIVKNVTKYELGENVEELTERFKRGDASRNTDGSGLGLAIAQSIVDLHKGTMEIALNGDLFQVTIRLPQ